MSKMKNMLNFDESLCNYNSMDGYIDQEYQEFEQKVLSGEILEKDCKNPIWLDLYYTIRKNHSKKIIKEISELCSNSYRDLKDGEFRDMNPDDFDDFDEND